MKKLTLFYVVLLSIPILFLPNGFAEDYTQWNLSEGAKMRLGKGAINDVKFSRNGGLLAVATNIGVWLYDAHVGAEICYSTKTRKTSKQWLFHRMVKHLPLAVGPRKAEFNYGTLIPPHKYLPWVKV